MPKGYTTKPNALKRGPKAKFLPTPMQEEFIRAARAQKMKLQFIADKLKCTLGQLQHYCVKHDLRKRVPRKQHWKRIAHAYAWGMNITAICKMVNCQVQTVYRALRAYEIPLRSRKQQPKVKAIPTLSIHESNSTATILSNEKETQWP